MLFGALVLVAAVSFFIFRKKALGREAGKLDIFGVLAWMLGLSFRNAVSIRRCCAEVLSMNRTTFAK
jgi:hypothetical protein